MSLTVGRDAVVAVHYRLTSDSGETLEQSPPDAPLVYLHGRRSIVAGLEEALEGSAAGQRVQVTVEPKKGYGERKKAKTMRLLRSSFPVDATITRGSSFILEGPEGDFPVWVTKVMGREIHVTAQHPLAGQTLHYDCTVDSVRPATDEEKRRGRPTPASGGGCSCC